MTPKTQNQAAQVTSPRWRRNVIRLPWNAVDNPDALADARHTLLPAFVCMLLSVSVAAAQTNAIQTPTTAPGTNGQLSSSAATSETLSLTRTAAAPATASATNA